MVTYDNYAYVESGFTKDAGALTRGINGLSAGGGTDIDAALLEADNLLRGSGAAIHAIVLMSDGLPQHSEEYTGPSPHYTESEWGYYAPQASTVYATAKSLPANYAIYTLGFFHALMDPELRLCRQLLIDIATENNYYELDNPNDLQFAFGDITDEMIDEYVEANPPEDKNYPIIIVPGLFSTDLRILFESTSYSDDYYRNKNIGYGGDKSYGTDFTKAYKSLIDALRKEYPKREMYFFGYDYLDSTAINADALATWISRKNFEKVELIAHSMGGLLVAQYMNILDNRDKVSHAITIATPYEGAPEIFLISNRIKGSALSNLHHIRGALELAPSENYVNTVPFYQSRLFHGSEPINYATYADLFAKLMPEGNTISIVKAVQDKIQSGIKSMQDFPNAFFIYGMTTEKLTAFTYTFYTGYGLRDYIGDMEFTRLGDGTVPFVSASSPVLDLPRTRHKYISGEHSAIVNCAETIEEIKYIIKNGRTNTGGSGAGASGGKPYIVVRIACPVDTEISGGSGALFNTPDEVVKEADFGKLYLIGESNDIKIYAIDAGVYDVKLAGTGEGAMDYEVRFFDGGDELTEARTFEDVPITPDTVITSEIDQGGETVLNVDHDGDGVVDEVLKAGVGMGGSPPPASPGTGANAGAGSGTGGFTPFQIVLIVLLGAVVCAGTVFVCYNIYRLRQ